jgi:hypothetical protein
VRRVILIATILLVSLTASAQDSVYRRRASSAAVAETVQWLYGGSDSDIGSNATTFYSIHGYGGHAAATSVGSRQSVVTAGTINYLWGFTDTASVNDIGDSTTIAYTLYKNGSSTGLTCTITGTLDVVYDRFCASQPINSPVSVADGDYLEMRVVSTGTIRANTRAKWAVQFNPTVNNEFVFPFGYSHSLAPGTGQYVRAGAWFQTASAAENTTNFVAPTAGTFTDIMARATTTLTAGSEFVTLKKNGSDTALSCELTTSGATCSDSETISVAVGDSFTIVVTSTVNGACIGSGDPYTCCTGSGTGTCATTPTSNNIGVSLVFTPTTFGRYFLWNASGITLNNSAARQQTINGSRNTDTNTFRLNGFPFVEYEPSGSPLVDLISLYAKIDNAPTGGQSWTVHFREMNTVDSGSGTDTSRGNCVIDSSCGSAPCSCTIDLTSETPRSNSTGPSLYHVGWTPSGTPTVPQHQMSVEVGQP